MKAEFITGDPIMDMLASMLGGAGQGMQVTHEVSCDEQDDQVMISGDEQDDQVMISVLAGLAKPGDDLKTIRKNIITAKAYAEAVESQLKQDAEDAEKALIDKQKEEERKRFEEKINTHLKCAEANLAYFKDRLSKREAEAAESDAAIKLMGIPERPTTSIGIAIRQERSNLATAIENLKMSVTTWETEVGLCKKDLNGTQAPDTEKVC